MLVEKRLGIQLDVLLQQASRVGHELWVLYVDLATFFPSIDRGALRLVELQAGLPAEVLDLAAAIYGKAECEADGTPCRYDSAAGLGGLFSNWMGALMGCVLSPNRAKLFVNSIIAAIQVSVKAVRLWGCAPATAGEAWEALSQLAFADDWAGTARGGGAALCYSVLGARLRTAGEGRARRGAGGAAAGGRPGGAGTFLHSRRTRRAEVVRVGSGGGSSASHAPGQRSDGVEVAGHHRGAQRSCGARAARALVRCAQRLDAI